MLTLYLSFRLQMVKGTEFLATTSNLVIPISLHTDGVNYLKSLKRFTTLGCKDIGIRKSEFAAKLVSL